MTTTDLTLFDESDIVKELRLRCATDPYSFARKHGLEVSYLLNVLSGHQHPSRGLARILGFRPSAQRWVKIDPASADDNREAKIA